MVIVVVASPIIGRKGVNPMNVFGKGVNPMNVFGSHE